MPKTLLAPTHVRLAALAFVAALASCTVGEQDPPGDGRDGGSHYIRLDGGFRCLDPEHTECSGETHLACEFDGTEFFDVVQRDCEAESLVCDDELGCVICRPDTAACHGDDAVKCRADGSGWETIDECDRPGGEICSQGACQNTCAIAGANRSYVGCEFYAADLDNAALGRGKDASAQQYAIVVSNPGDYPADVVIEIDRSAYGEETRTEIVEMRTVLAGDLEVFELPRREVDGSSGFAPCDSDDDCTTATDRCWCRDGETPDDEGASDCRCRVRAEANGMSDGTHSALSTQAYRVRSNHPLVAYQFNPLDNVSVFSNDASLLLPSSGTGNRYTVVGWPQTIANSDLPEENFDPTRTDEDLRAFLTVIGATENTRVKVTLGPLVRNVVGLTPGTYHVAGDVLEVDLGEFDVLNLETEGFNADFTSTIVEANRPVTVFSGSEASDAPRFDDLANRQCCADHLEEQLFPDEALGQHFFIGRTPRRTTALNSAFLDPTRDSVGEFNEPEWVRIVAVSAGTTQVHTSLPRIPDDFFELTTGQSVILRADQDVEIDASQPVSVLQIIASQDAVGIPRGYPGGDPSILAVPPVSQYRSEYVFLTPDNYAFDFVTIVAPAGAEMLLDEQPIGYFDCEIGPADGVERDSGDPPAEWLVYRCQLSYPDVIGLPNVRVEEGLQDDGYHTLRATSEVSLMISGFDAYVSYGYAGGADLDATM